MSKDQQLRQEVEETITEHKILVGSDPYRLHFHIMPPVGLLNDPNGFIYWRGNYHLFYQWMPFKTDHGAKFWGHYTSKDLVHWNHEKIALTPSEWFEKNGCYSGSAIEHDGKMMLFYTGNVKDEQGKRSSYQCLAISEDGLEFEKMGPVVELPSEYTPHFRDPKVWKHGEKHFMVVGAQTTNGKGAVALLRSVNLLDWEHIGILAGGGQGKLKDFGYMFECPDLFHLDGKDVLIFSPQGLSSEGIKYQNVYQSGYVIGNFNPSSGSFEHDNFEELDRGFDFYAPQTTLDNNGRRLMFGWMAVPDQNEQHHPSINYKWLHNMTIPRELFVVEGKVQQWPVQELEGLRIGEAVQQEVTILKEDLSVNKVCGKVVELLLEEISLMGGWFDIVIGGAVRLVYSAEEKSFTVERQSYVNGVTEKRQCQLNDLHSLRIFVDTSSVEVFINHGEETFTSRFYPQPSNSSIRFGTSSSVSFVLKKWNLTKTS